ncbi:MAG: DUF3078 domain-containing protein [Puia sp.]|nr:DUF3078 domain-containing protein [Puia sp.]
MRKLSTVLLLTLVSISFAHAQISIQQMRDESDRSVKKDPSDTLPRKWKTGGLYNLNFTQAALSNWSAGGDKSAISLSTLLSMYAFYQEGKNSWDNTLDMVYGLVSTTSLGTRKSDDRIDLLSKYGYDLGKKLFFSGLFNFRSQFTKGYSYPDANTKVLTSNFAAPAYVIFSLGMDYKPDNHHFSLFVSPATARWVIVNNDSLAKTSAYGVDSGKHSRFEFGAFSSITYNTVISKSTTYKSRLDLFSNYLRRPQDVSIYWTNILAVKVTRLISMSLSLDMIYDNDIKSVHENGTQGGPALQLKEVMGIGLAYKFDNKKKLPPKPPATYNPPE